MTQISCAPCRLLHPKTAAQRFQTRQSSHLTFKHVGSSLKRCVAGTSPKDSHRAAFFDTTRCLASHLSCSWIPIAWQRVNVCGCDATRIQSWTSANVSETHQLLGSVAIWRPVNMLRPGREILATREVPRVPEEQRWRGLESDPCVESGLAKHPNIPLQ